jgi:hypothetical protein
LAVSQLVRMAISSIAVRSLEQTLFRTTPDDAALEAAQKALADEAGFDALLVAWRGERATLFGMLEAVDSGKVPLAQIQETFRNFGKDAAWPADAGPGSPALKSARVWSLRFMTPLVEVAKKPLPVQPAALAALRPGQPPALLAPLLDLQNQLSGGGVQGAYHRRAALLRSAVVAVAAERYRLKHGRWPLEVKEIDAALVATPPTDPYDGAALRLRRVDGGLVVYSIGGNGRDDGGDLGDRGLEAPDVGFRLSDAEKRR